MGYLYSGIVVASPLMEDYGGVSRYFDEQAN